MSSAVVPFRIDVPAIELEVLSSRLAAARWPDEIEGAGWDYGVAAGYLRSLVQYWRTGFDWNGQFERLNAVPQFTTEVDGQRIHFLHARSGDPEAVPVLLIHGWPSTVADFLPVIGPLTDPASDSAANRPAFHVVAPSLPGFGFSGPTRDRGWGVPRMAAALAGVMQRLGYSRYLVQGGDYGSLIAAQIGRIDPGAVLGVHLNGPITPFDSDDPDLQMSLTPADREAVAAADALWEQRSGYAAIQSTRPQTLAYALNDSPVGLLAWDLEWFVDYDPTTSVQTPVSRDAILTDVTITWLTRTAGSSARLYRERGSSGLDLSESGVPTAVAVFPGDATIRALAERSHRIVRWTEYARGGHFASLQAPDLLVDDLRRFAETLVR